MKQVKIFVEDVAQGLGIDQTVNLWLESMADSVEVESIQVCMGAYTGNPTSEKEAASWPLAVLVVYRAKQ